MLCSRPWDASMGDAPKPHSDLQSARNAMTWTVEEGSFALIGCPSFPTAADLQALQPPSQLIVEAGETTFLVREEQAPSVLSRHPGSSIEESLAWIRFEAAMGWEVVGFLAEVAGTLSAHGVPVGAVCSFSRDHLFVARRYLTRAEEALLTLYPRSD